jgi:sec-independent protein translocase protein TatC
VARRSRRGGNPDGRMTLGQHLIELRRRLFIAAIGILLCSVAGWFVSDFIWDALRVPILEIAHAEHRDALINYSDLASAFDIRLQISMVVGVVASSPLWLYQILAFIVPGLNQKERRYTFGFLFTAVPLFLAGCAAGLFVVPRIVAVLTSFVPQQDASFVEAKSYLGLVLKLVLAVGIAFVLPVFLVLLNFIGIVSAKAMLKAWRWAVLVILLFAAIATPSADVGSMFLLALPITLLYFLAVGVSFWHDRGAAKRQEEILSGSSTPAAV